MMTDPRLQRICDEHRYPLLFATISGAHLYGFPSPDSDYDLRGAHILPLVQVVSLDAADDTLERMEDALGLELDLVTHDVAKFFRLLLRPNGYVLEQLFSPLIVRTTPEHAELKAIASACITRHHAHHYLGFAANQWRLFERENPPRVKPLLYVYRVLLTGIHLMRSGEIQANLVELNREFKLSHVDELVRRKTEGPERVTLDAGDLSFHRSEVRRLELELRQAHERTALREAPAARSALNDLLVRIRLAHPA